MKKLVLLTAIAAVPLAACGGKTTKTAPAAPADPTQPPQWVTRGSGAFGGDTKVFYAVGAKSGLKNSGLMMSAAANMARAEMQRTFETYTASLMKDYSSSVSTGDGSDASEEQMVESAVKTFAAGVLNGVEIVDQWRDPKSGTQYALARLDLSTFTEKIEKAKELGEKVKERVRRSAERAFSDLEREEAKQQGSE